MRTETEAGDMWCPMVRSEVDGNSVSRDSDGHGAPWNSCIASRCMMWRWGDVKPNQRFHVCEASPTATDEQPRDTQTPPSWTWVPAYPEDAEPAGWLEPKQEAESRRRGYCGLAGPGQFR